MILILQLNSWEQNNDNRHLLRVTSSHHYDPKPHGIFVQVFEHDEETNQDGREVSDRIQIYKEQDNVS